MFFSTPQRLAKVRAMSMKSIAKKLETTTTKKETKNVRGSRESKREAIE